MHCLGIEHLQRFVQGGFDERERASADLHLATCNRCTVSLARIARSNGAKNSHTPVDTKDPWIGLLLDDRYMLTKPLGQGSMGTVYAAVDEHQKLPVAVKMLHGRVVSHPNAIERFEVEGRICASLGHPGILRVLQSNLGSDPPYLVMELLSGETLSQQIARGPTPHAEASAIIAQIAAALATVHEHGVIHRDIKPANIFITTDGRAKLLDFGICHLMQPSRELTMSHHFVGTPHYAAPELFENAKSASIASDIYALGCVLYELLTGEALFSSDSLASLVRQKQADQSSKLATLGASPLRLVLTRMLEQDPIDRFSSASQFTRALDSAMQGGASTLGPFTQTTRPTEQRSTFRDHETRAIELAEEGQDVAAAAHFALAALSAAKSSLAPEVLRLSGIALGIESRDRSHDYELYVARGQALRMLGRVREQLQDLELAKEQTTFAWQRARLEIDHAFALLTLGETGHALSRLRANDTSARQSTSPHVLALHLGTLAVVLAYATEVDEAEGPLAEAEVLVQSQVPSLRPNASIWRAQLAGVRGDLWARHQAYKLATVQYEELGDLQNAAGAAANLADIYNALGMYTEASAALSKAIDQCVALGNTLVEGYARCNLGYALMHLHDDQALALAELGRASSFAKNSGDSRLARHVQLYHAEGFFRAGAFEEAATLAATLRGGLAETDEVAAHAAALEVACRLRMDTLNTQDNTARAFEVAWSWWQTHERMEEREGIFLLRVRDALLSLGRKSQAEELSARVAKQLRSRAARIGDASWRTRFNCLPGHAEFLGTASRLD